MGRRQHLGSKQLSATASDPGNAGRKAGSGAAPGRWRFGLAESGVAGWNLEQHKAEKLAWQNVLQIG